MAAVISAVMSVVISGVFDSVMSAAGWGDNWLVTRRSWQAATAASPGATIIAVVISADPWVIISGGHDSAVSSAFIVGVCFTEAAMMVDGAIAAVIMATIPGRELFPATTHCGPACAYRPLCKCEVTCAAVVTAVTTAAT